MQGLRIAVLGATGSAGGALLTRLADSAFAGAEVLAFASRAARSESVAMGERSLPVHLLADVHEHGPRLAFCTLPPAVARQVVPDLVARGVFVVDVGNSTAGVVDAPLALPWVRPPNPADLAAAGAARTPSAVGWLLASALAPLFRAGIERATGVVNLPATAYGRAAGEELSEQVVASFNLKEPPRRLFGDGLAFDTLPADNDPGEWSDREGLASAEVAELLGIDPSRVAFQVVTQPIFAGMTAGIYARGEVDSDAAESLLRGSAGLASAARSALVRPRRVMGRSPVYWTGLRDDPSGQGVHFWVAGDNLAGAAAAAPVAVAEAALEAGLLSGLEA